MRKYLFLLLLCLGTLAACNSDDSVFKTSPTTRAQEAVDALKQRLVSAPYGWRVLYFSRTDSLLYTRPRYSSVAPTRQLRIWRTLFHHALYGRQ